MDGERTGSRGPDLTRGEGIRVSLATNYEFGT
jgi:hypothetical protein